MAVGKLQEKLDVAASTLSHHLKALVGVGLVTQTREGTTLICHTNYDDDARPDRIHASRNAAPRAPARRAAWRSCYKGRLIFLPRYFDDSSRIGVTPCPTL